MKKSDKNIVAGLSEPYKVEGILARMERANRRLFIALICSLVICSMLIVVIIDFIRYERQFETVEETVYDDYYDYEVEQEADGSGYNRFNIVGRDGNIYDGAAEGTSSD